jgi:hypothetical protein
MTFYARPSWRLVRQIAADAFAVAWTATWWFVGRAVDGTIRALAAPARQAAQTASDLQRQLLDAAAQAASIPFVGDGLRQPFEAMAGSVNSLAASATTQATAVEGTATMVGLVIFLIPALSLVAVWLPARLRFATRARELRALASDPQGTELLALRALTHTSLARLASIGPDPVAAWRSGDPETLRRLAALELKRAGVSRPSS